MQRTIRFFVSYAHADRLMADRLLGHLRRQMAAAKYYEYALWRDTAILPGEDWEHEIGEALDGCEIGLLLVSPSFVASTYISRVEIPHFLTNEAKPVIPVMLEPVDLDRQELRGLEEKQLFRWLSPKGIAKSYADCIGQDRRRFCETLFQQIEGRLDRLFKDEGR